MKEKEQLIQELIREDSNVTIKEYLQLLFEINHIMKANKKQTADE